MYLSELYAKTEDGIRITRAGKKDIERKVCKSNGLSWFFNWFTNGLSDNDVLANDWEVVKEKEKVKSEMTMREFKQLACPSCLCSRISDSCHLLNQLQHVPDDAKVTIEFER